MGEPMARGVTMCIAEPSKKRIAEGIRQILSLLCRQNINMPDGMQEKQIALMPPEEIIRYTASHLLRNDLFWEANQAEIIRIENEFDRPGIKAFLKNKVEKANSIGI